MGLKRTFYEMQGHNQHANYLTAYSTFEEWNPDQEIAVSHSFCLVARRIKLNMTERCRFSVQRH